MNPETIMNLINISIIVLVTTIIYCVILIIARAHGLAKRIEKREKEFYNQTMTRFMSGKWRDLNGRQK